MKKEPAVIISALTALATAIIGVLAVFGLNLSDDQRNAILGLIGPFVLVIALLGPVIRQFVYSPHTVEKIADTQYRAGEPPTEPQPEIPPPGNV